jgi:katanin p80 WD40 repeat-containing subunit B1
MVSPKFSNLNMELLPPLLDKAKILVDSKYMAHIKGGMEFLKVALYSYRDEIITMK